MTDPRTLVAGQIYLAGTYVLSSTTAHAPPGSRYTTFTGALLDALARPRPLDLDEITPASSWPV
ncbi:hypothetical protein ACQP1S_06315 [Micromonospora matsumotoense]|uniref:hypothetical protein n=1 Tax=Micromonospora matsumotoense TaxID=121616 RepID=UPI003D8BA04E